MTLPYLLLRGNIFGSIPDRVGSTLQFGFMFNCFFTDEFDEGDRRQQGAGM